MILLRPQQRPATVFGKGRGSPRPPETPGAPCSSPAHGSAALANWLEHNVPDSLKFFPLPEAHRVRLRTSNSQENLNRQIRRRTRVATIFPNLESLLRLSSAILVEISEEWENSKAYLNMNQTKATDSAA